MSAAPRFAAFGEALTDFVRQGDDVWRSVPGGAPWNVARAMAAFGVASAFGGAISRDCFGDALWQASLEARLDTRGVQRVDKSPLLAMVHVTDPPQYFFVVDDSADLHFDVDALPDEWLAGLRWALFGGISLAREPLSGRLLALAERLKRGGTKIAYDPNFRVLMDERYDPTLARMLALADHCPAPPASTPCSPTAPPRRVGTPLRASGKACLRQSMWSTPWGPAIAVWPACLPVCSTAPRCRVVNLCARPWPPVRGPASLPARCRLRPRNARNWRRG